MRIQVVTLFPELISSVSSSGVLGTAIRRGLLTVECIQPRDFAADLHRSVDDRPFGGGDGMIMMPEILSACVRRAREKGPTRVIYLSPQGPRLDDAKVRQLSKEPSLTLICGRYGGVDQRALNVEVDEELSIGDYVLAGGELPAMVVVESVSRMIPGVLGHAESAHNDSFAEGVLEHPNFTRPREWEGCSVPAVLLSGNHLKIEEWKLRVSQLVTLKKRPELFRRLSLDDQKAARDYWREMGTPDREACHLQGLHEADFEP